MFLLQIISTVPFLVSTLAYVLKCPHHSQFAHRGTGLCDKTEMIYMCLDDQNSKHGIEICKEKKGFQRPGYKLVWSWNFDGQVCSKDRYQPIKYYTNDGIDCILQKSNCNEEGQLSVSNGTGITDKTCRCDHSKGYAFIQPPANSSYCIPSERDCSCYRKDCSTSQILTADYACEQKHSMDCAYVCPNSKSYRNRVLSVEHTSFFPFREEASLPKRPSNDLRVITCLICFFIGIILGFILLIFGMPESDIYVREKSTQPASEIKEEKSKLTNIEDIAVIWKIPYAVSADIKTKPKTVAIIGRNNVPKALKDLNGYDTKIYKPDDLDRQFYHIRFCAIFITVELGNFTEEVYETVKRCVKCFGNDVDKHVIVTFVSTDSIKETFEENLKKVPKLQVFLELFGIKYFLCEEKESQTTDLQLQKEIINMIESLKPVRICQTTIKELKENFKQECKILHATSDSRFIDICLEISKRRLYCMNIKKGCFCMTKYSNDIFEQVCQSMLRREYNYRSSEVLQPRR